MQDYFSLPNITFCIGLVILVVANFILIISISLPPWGNVAFFLLYLMIINLAGFPLVPILYIILLFAGFIGSGETSKIKKWGFFLGLLLMNILLVGQWFLWGQLLQFIFSY